MGVIEKRRIAVDKVADVLRARKDKYSASAKRIQGFMGSVFEIAKNGSTFTGITDGAASAISGAIAKYVSAIQTEIGKIRTDLNPSNALKGQLATEAQNYVGAVADAASAYVSTLLSYGDQMFKWAEAFKTNETELASTVQEETNALKESAEVYTPQNF